MSNHDCITFTHNNRSYTIDYAPHLIPDAERSYAVYNRGDLLGYIAGSKDERASDVVERFKEHYKS